MSQTVLGFCVVIIGLLMAILNKPLAETAINLRERMHLSTLSLGWARAFPLVGGLLFAVVGLLVMLNLVG
jgi:hypothetical protein